MKECLEIGSSPSDESCAQVGDENYSSQARKECSVWIEQLKREVGKVYPNFEDLISFKVKSNRHDFGTYYEVAVCYDTENEDSVRLAFMVESDASTRWDDQSRKELSLPPQAVQDIMDDYDLSEEQVVRIIKIKSKIKEYKEILSYFDGHIFDIDKDYLGEIGKLDKMIAPYYFSLNFFVYGDYVGSFVEKSNHEAMEKILNENDIDYEGLREAYSTDHLLIPIDALDNNEILETLNSLNNYSLLDENDHSEKVLEAINDALEDDWKNLFNDEDLMTKKAFTERFYDTYEEQTGLQMYSSEVDMFSRSKEYKKITGDL